MKIQIVTKPPCRLDRGEARRIPVDRARRLLGYYVACTACGFTTPAVHGDGVRVVEGSADDDVTIADAICCLYCRGLIRIEHGEMSVVEATAGKDQA